LPNSEDQADACLRIARKLGRYGPQERIAQLRLERPRQVHDDVEFFV
jgi:hypothetical protein